MYVLHACCCHILNNFLLFIFIIVIFAENASFTRKLRRHLLALMALTTPKPRNTDIYQRTESTQRGHDITIRYFNYYYYITKTRRSEVTAHSSTSSCAYPHINMRTYVVGVFVQARII